MITLNLNTTYLLRLIKQYLESGGKDCSVPDFASEADFKEILRIAAHNNCDSFIYHTIWRWGAEYGVDASVMHAYKSRMLLSAASQLRADAELKEVITDLCSAGVRYLLLKGVILSSLYPDPAYRRSIDADIHVSDEYADLAAEVFIARGYEYIPNDHNKYVKTYRQNGILSIELHTRLFEHFYEKNRAAIVSSELESHSSRREVKVLDTIVETLSPNHFLIYVICHHTKHFITSGINLRHLIDICVYVNKYHEQLNWEFITSALERFCIKDFALYLLYICKQYLGMVDISFLFQDISEETVAMLIHDIIERTANIDGAIARASTYNIVRDIYYGKKKSITNVMKSSIFPNTKALSTKYSYAKKHPILLPAAWIHRAFYYIWRKVKGHRMISPAERTKLTKEKVELLKRVKIL